MTITFPNYELWTLLSLTIAIYNYFGTDWKKSKIDPFYWIALSFVPCIHVFSGILNVVYLGENQHLLKDNKLNRTLGFLFDFNEKNNK